MSDPGVPADAGEPGEIPASFTFDFTEGSLRLSGDVPMHTDHAECIIDVLRMRFGALLRPDLRDPSAKPRLKLVITEPEDDGEAGQ
jgi:hypothetical protein